MSQGSLDSKIRFIGQKVCSVARVHTDTQTHRQTHRQTDRHESEYRGHPFRVSGIFPSTYHQGSVQYGTNLVMNEHVSGYFTHRSKLHEMCLVGCWADGFQTNKQTYNVIYVSRYAECFLD